MFDGKKLKALRTRKRLTVFELAAKLYNLGHSRSTPTIRSWEKGERQPRVDDLHMLARVLGIEINDLITGPTVKKSKNQQSATV